MYSIDAVKLVDRKTYYDERGDLSEIYRTDEDYHPEGITINQVYVVHDPQALVVRAFHRHKKLWDFFSVVHGRAKFVLVDELGSKKTFIIDANDRKLLIVPPSVYHGWQSLMDDTAVLSIASHTYNRADPDEERVSYDSFGEGWEVKFK